MSESNPLTRIRTHAVSRGARTLLLLAAVATALPAAADTFEIQFTATVSSAFGDLSGPLAGGDTITGTFVVDDSVSGTFSPSGNPTFVRDEMLYPGAVVSTSLEVNGFAVSGSGGNIVLLDANEPLAGEDNYEVRGVVDTGTIGGATPESLVFVPEYDSTTFEVESGTVLFAPPPFDAGRFNPFTLSSASGGSAFGQIDGFTVVTAPEPVPALSPVASSLLATALATLGAVSVGWRRGSVLALSRSAH